MAKPIAKSEDAGKTNRTPGSLVRCEIKVEKGEWISPDSCAIFQIDEDAKLPEICFEIKTENDGPYVWSWELQWNALACPQRRDKPRFKQKTVRSFREKGKFESPSKKWIANFNDMTVGGTLTVKVVAGTAEFVRKISIKGSEPGQERVLAELGLYKSTYPAESELAIKIFKQETKFSHFFFGWGAIGFF